MLIARLRFYFFHLNLKRRLWLRSVGMTLLFRVFPCRILGSKPLNSFFILELIFSWDAEYPMFYNDMHPICSGGIDSIMVKDLLEILSVAS
ncbi:hypothetical protein AN697_27380 [Enterobacter cloacae subsp. cloacae]|nr:hypothetical protein AN697_27380 [Enterobacter cloacae subsp. cloacae]